MLDRYIDIPNACINHAANGIIAPTIKLNRTTQQVIKLSRKESSTQRHATADALGKASNKKLDFRIIATFRGNTLPSSDAFIWFI